MQTPSDTWIGWAIALAIAVPVVLVVLTEVLGSLTRRGSAAAKPVRLLRNWVVPVAALLALLALAFQSEADQSGREWSPPCSGSWSSCCCSAR